MKTSLCKIFLVVFLLSSLLFPAQHVEFDELKIVDDMLCVSYHIVDFLDEKNIEALQRGIKSEVVHTMQLWQQKSFINPREKQKEYRIKVFWDNWEKKYRLETEDENRLTPHIETVKQKCAFIENFPLAKTSDLERGKKYHVSISVNFQLISAESYNAISDIFAGEKKDQDTSAKKKSGFVSVLVNLLGFGDKEYAYKTKDFIITESGIIEFVP
ncbi:DUF4390 domain-containing protein [candidate division KSB1 bacterium]|nr:DUF4390 domain-containing protein [candidate division KSB1 bacterium]RQW06084.1 MAG: DUF4390 domain-containing protein [candidate division KSB1 bacterium]